MSKLFKRLAARNPGSEFARRFGYSGSQRYTGIRPPGPGDYQDIQDPGWPGGERPAPRRPRGRPGRAGGARGTLGPTQQR